MKSGSTSKPPWLAAAPAAFLLLWSLGFPVAKISLLYVEPMTFLALRYALVLAILLPIFVVLRPALPRTPIEWLHIAVVGFLIQVVYYAGCYFAFAKGEKAGTVALIVSLQPILVALCAPLVASENVGLVRWVGLIFGLVGAGIVILVRSATEVASWSGILLIVAALFGMTGSALYEKRFGIHQHPVTANIVQYAVGLAATVPLALVLEQNVVRWTPQLLASLGYLVIGNSIISITLYLAMIRYGEVSRVSALFFLVPPLTALLSWMMLGEVIPLLAWPGIALAAIGVALAVWPSRRFSREATSPPDLPSRDPSVPRSGP
jgi:drug/metabolite transporter (DMT)-like permease